MAPALFGGASRKAFGQGWSPSHPQAVSGPEGKVLLDWCRWVLSGESALPEAGPSLTSTSRRSKNFWPAAPHPPFLGGGGSVPEMEKVEEERVGEALFEKASEYLDLSVPIRFLS